MTSTLRNGPFDTSADHLLCEIERIGLLIRGYAALVRKESKSDDPYQGLYISNADIDKLIADPIGLLTRARSTAPDQLHDALSSLSETIENRVALTLARGGRLRVCELRDHFKLTSLDLDILLFCIAPELDPKFGRIFAWLHDDVTKQRPTVDLVLNVFSMSFADKLARRERLLSGAPLIRHRLVELFDEPGNQSSSFPNRYIRPNARILSFLLGSNDIDQDLEPYVSCKAPRNHVGALINSAEMKEFIDRAEAVRRTNGRLSFHLYGPAGVGKKTWAAALCLHLGQKLLLVDGSAIAVTGLERFASLAAAIVRETLLQGAVLYWCDIDALLSEDRRPLRDLLLTAIGEFNGTVVISGLKPWEGEIGAKSPKFTAVGIRTPTTAERTEIWTRVLSATALPEVIDEIPVIATKFRFTAGKITAAANAALAKARWRAPSSPVITLDDIYACCREQSNARLGQLARKMHAKYKWEDLVLPDEAIRQLREVCGRVRHGGVVMEDWGFGTKLSIGKGLSTLFTGPTGTGKTMAAEIMAAELQLDLYRIDLSNVVSKYIGETEKNLAQVFREAEASSAILFFDEADALFGKRSEVKDAHDRYANVETSYLLQRMEEYDGISILATNLRRNMDDAFTRRIAYIVQFPVPEAPERSRIWRNVFPAETPLHCDVDLEFMSENFKLSGGSIKNIAIAAAFLAAEHATSLSMVHLVRATSRELQKLGKNSSGGEFGKYAHML